MAEHQWPNIVLTEEGMREGMQIESAEISLEDKVRLLNALSETGLKRIVVGSFVHPKWTPQMAQVDELIERMTPKPGVTYLGLALNEKGRERARAHVPPLTVEESVPTLHTHLCDIFIQRNTNRTQEEEQASWPAIIEKAVNEGKKEANIAVSSAWGSNWRGPISQETRFDALQAHYDRWTEAGLTVTGVALLDPMGWCAPHWVASDIREIKRRWPSVTNYKLHLHNTRGLAVASIYAAMVELKPTDTLMIETTIGGIGGCPYCGNGRAAGMAPTEDVIQMFEAMGIDTGVDLYKLVDAVQLASEIIGRQLHGFTSKAGPMPRGDRLYSEDVPVIETFNEAQHFRLGEDAYENDRRPWLDRQKARAKANA
jgi:hydroxymethylglutaryl-CoA lyase